MKIPGQLSADINRKQESASDVTLLARGSI